MCLISSVVGGVEVCPPLGDFGRALFRSALIVLRGRPGVASWLSHEGLTKFYGGLGHENGLKNVSSNSHSQFQHHVPDAKYKI